MGYYGRAKSGAPELRLQQMNVRVLSYVAWAAFLLGVGLLDLQIYFAPVGTFFVVLFMVVAFFYRRIIETYVLTVSVRRGFIVISICMVAINLLVGLSLNSMADHRARILISRIESYKQMHGEFPKSLLVIADDADLHLLKENRLVLGSRFAYESDGRAFHFSYSRYPTGDWMWGQDERKFQPALD
jgi:hypothetical protein